MFCTVLLFFVIARPEWTQGQSTGNPNRNEGSEDVYKRLYLGELAADAAVETAILQRLDQGDYQTVKNVMFGRLKVDLMMIKLQTNFSWTEEQKKGIQLAEQYRAQKEKK